MMAVEQGKAETQVAQKIQTLFIDDIDGGAAEGTVRFALDGTDYEIDLNAKHSEELRSALGRYVSHARKVGGSARRAGRAAGRGSRGSSSALNTTEIRNWAREQGYDIKDRGRVPADLVAKYQAATGKLQVCRNTWFRTELRSLFEDSAPGTVPGVFFVLGMAAARRHEPKDAPPSGRRSGRAQREGGDGRQRAKSALRRGV